jgi:hypothetical protein
MFWRLATGLVREGDSLLEAIRRDNTGMAMMGWKNGYEAIAMSYRVACCIKRGHSLPEADAFNKPSHSDLAQRPRDSHV